ncbi:unnamed protein product [Lampetra fluviatilis]
MGGEDGTGGGASVTPSGGGGERRHDRRGGSGTFRAETRRRTRVDGGGRHRAKRNCQRNLSPRGKPGKDFGAALARRRAGP